MFLTKYLILFYFFIVATGMSSFAQDPSFSQFYANRIYLNPAYAGFEPGGTISVNYRDQWFGIPGGDFKNFDASLRTFMLTTELQLPCIIEREGFNFGTALSLFRDEAGGAPLKTTGVAWALSYEVSNLIGNKSRKKGRRKNKRDKGKPTRIDGEKKKRKKNKTRRKLTRLDLRMGIQPSVKWKSLSGGYLIYSEQLDPVREPTALSGTMDFSRKGIWDINAGVMLRGEFGKRLSPMMFTIGISSSNLLESYQSIESEFDADPLPRRYTFHLGFTYRLNNGSTTKAPTDFTPHFRWDTQLDGRLNGQTIGGYILSKAYYYGLFLQYNFPTFNEDSGVAGNFLAKNTSTLILNAGVDIKSLSDKGKPWKKRRSGFVMGLTYDINLGGLKSGNTLGALELSLKWNLKGEKSGKRCGEIGRFELYDGDCPVSF